MWCGVVCGAVWCGVVCDVVWCVTWCGVVWCVTWCGVVWCGTEHQELNMTTRPQESKIFFPYPDTTACLAVFSIEIIDIKL